MRGGVIPWPNTAFVELPPLLMKVTRLLNAPEVSGENWRNILVELVPATANCKVETAFEESRNWNGPTGTVEVPTNVALPALLMTNAACEVNPVTTIPKSRLAGAITRCAGSVTRM